MPDPRPRAAFVSQSPEQIERVYGPESRARLNALADFEPGILGPQDLPRARGVDYLFSTWGMPALDEAAWRELEGLKAVFYAAGSVQSFARPLLKAGVRLFSAWHANAIPVAEYCLAQILLAGKGFLPGQMALRQQGPQAWHTQFVRGNRGSVVALLGAGKVARALIQLLKPHGMRVLVYDPFLSDAQAAELGVAKVSLQAAFAEANVVSNHLPDLAETKGMIHGPLVQSMRQGALFLNTGRGATVEEAGLWQALQARPDLYAVLDVSHPEPPLAESPAYRLPNVYLSAHVAGSLGTELEGMALAMADEFEALLRGRPLQAEVTLAMLETMA